MRTRYSNEYGDRDRDSFMEIGMRCLNLVENVSLTSLDQNIALWYCQSGIPHQRWLLVLVQFSSLHFYMLDRPQSCNANRQSKQICLRAWTVVCGQIITERHPTARCIWEGSVLVVPKNNCQWRGAKQWRDFTHRVWRQRSSGLRWFVYDLFLQVLDMASMCLRLASFGL